MIRKALFQKSLGLILIFTLLAGCAPKSTPTAAPLTTNTPVAATATAAPLQHNIMDGCVAEGQYDASIDYFPEKTLLSFTEGFEIEYYNNYKIVTVNMPYPGATESMQYALVQCGTPAPEGFAAGQIIEVPVKTVVTMSTTYLPFLDELGVLDRLVGMDDATYVNNPGVLQMAEDGKLTMIGYGSNVDVEKTLELNPDLILTYGSGAPDYDAFPVLMQAGLKVVVDAEWLDTTPLGRAEWGKFIAIFFNLEAKEDAIFTKTANNYNKYADLATNASEKPVAFTGSAYQGTWSMPGGNSFMAILLKEAGANYPWAEDPSTGSLPLAFEAVFDKAQNADYWVNVGFFGTLDDVLAADARYANFAAYLNGNLWNHDAKSGPAGGNDFYESAVAHPDIVLADLIKIFHPDLLPEHEMVYYRQMK